MADFEEISFVIPGHTPDTMPLNRLLEYLHEMSVVLDEPEKLHLVAIKESSCAPVFHTDTETALRVKENAERVQRGDGTKKQVDAYNGVRRMLRRDGIWDRPALLRTPKTVVMQIDAAPAETPLSGVRQASSVDGAVIRVGGAGEYASIQLQDLDGTITSGFTARRSLAKELAHLMWEPVRLFGVGQWCRSEDGEWRLERMQVQGFDPLVDESLGMTISKLRAARVAWPADSFEKLQRDREE
jgi:hypothetical protein